MNANEADERPLFILGCPRSGTTLLRLMLNGHPRFAVPPETRFVLPAYYRRASFGDLREEDNRRRFASWLIDTPQLRFADLGLDAEQTTRAITQAAPGLGPALAAVFGGYAERFDKQRWGDKLPTYIEHVDALIRLFPDAQFLHIIRDGRDCVASLKRQPWWRKGTPAAVGTWNRAIDYGRRARRRLPADSWHEVRYEDLVAAPGPVLVELCDFLGEPFHEAMLDPQRRAAMMRRGRLRGPLRHEVTAAGVGGWVTQLAPWEIALMHGVSAGRLRSHGYPVEDAVPAAQDRTALRNRAPLPLIRYARADIQHRYRRRLTLSGDRRVSWRGRARAAPR